MKFRLFRNFAIIFSGCLFIYACESSPKQNGKSDTANIPVSRIDLPNPISPLDQSPMDMAYFPVEFSKLKMLGKSDSLPLARVIFSRPQKNGRKIFGNVVKYGEPWRLGANEATEIEFFRDVMIQGKKIIKGRYVLYCIPQPDKWTLILNGDLYTWGLKIDRSKDLIQFDFPITKLNQPIEIFTIEFEKTNEGANLLMGWDDVKVSAPIKFQ